MKNIPMYWWLFPAALIVEIVLAVLQMNLIMTICTGLIWFSLLTAWYMESGNYSKYLRRNYPDAYKFAVKKGDFSWQLHFQPNVKNEEFEALKQRVSNFRTYRWIIGGISALPWIYIYFATK